LRFSCDNIVEYEGKVSKVDKKLQNEDELDRKTPLAHFPLAR
jgi:hypothetical protein